MAALMGGALSSSIVAGALGCSRRKVREWRPRTLGPEQDRLVTVVAELILPATDTPGAAEAGVNEFIDLLLTDWLDAEERERFLAGLADLDAAAVAGHGRPFLELAPEQQIALLEPLDLEAAQARQAAALAGIELEDPSFFGMMKEMTLVGYYTSEIGMTQELHHLRAAGSYDGCMPLSEVGRTWA